MKRLINKLNEIGRYLVVSCTLASSPVQSALLFYLFLRLYLHDYAHFIFRVLPVPQKIGLKSPENRICYLQVPKDITFVVALSEIFVRKDYDVELLPAPGIIFDIGANFGLATVFFALKYPRATIYSFEPTAYNFSYLSRNTAQFPNVEIFKSAVYSHNNSIRLYLPKSGGGCNSIYVPGDDYEDVTCTTLDTFVDSRGLGRIDLVKIDVEGAEWEILKDCKSLKKVNAMVGELHFSIVDKDKMMGLLDRYFAVTLIPRDAPHRPVFMAKRRINDDGALAQAYEHLIF